MEALRSHIESIVRLTDAEYDRVKAAFTRKTYRKHQFVVQQGNPVSYDFFVLKGCLKAYLIGDRGKEHIIQFAMEDWWITDYDAYFNQVPATIDIDCIEDCELLAIARADREQLCREIHAMEHFWRMKLSAGYVALQKRIRSQLNQSIGDRYHALLQAHPKLIQRVPKRMLASYLGVSRETLSRIASRNDADM